MKRTSGIKIIGIIAITLLACTLGATTAYAAFPPSPTISSIDGQGTGGTIYINSTTNIAIAGTADPLTDLNVLVDGVPATTTPGSPTADGGGNYSFTFNTAASASTKSIVVRDTVNVLDSGAQNILVDVTNPTITDVHWQNPADGTHMGPNLSKIWAEVSDAGGAGVDYTTSTITFSPAVAGSTAQDGSDIEFIPTGNNWGLFIGGTTYTITVTLFDQAGNTISDSSHSFIVDRTNPTITDVHWQNSADATHVGPNLSKVWAVVSDAGGAGVDYTTSTITFAPAVAGSTAQDGANIEFIPTGNNWNLFLNGTTYTITVTLRDQAGNVATENTHQFTVDRTQPTISDVHWQNPADGSHVGPNLGKIWANVSDASSGVDYTSSTITFTPAVAGSTIQDGSDIEFIPTGNNWNLFLNGTTYTITVTLYDLAGNVRTNSTHNFTVDRTNPIITDVHWQNPADGTYVGPNLSKIWAVVSDATAGVDYSASTITFAPAVAGSTAQDGVNIEFIPTASNWNLFLDATNYTITVTLYDRAGNTVSNNSHNFNVDRVVPVASVVNWTSPANGDYAGPNLNDIWAIVADADAGIDWTASTLLVNNGIAGTNSDNGSNRIDFNPTNGWPSAPGDWVHNTLYTITATIYDTAGNVKVDSDSFRCDVQAPVLTQIRWQHPNRSSEVDNGTSYYMGEDLQLIWVDFADSITFTNSDPIDRGAGETEIIIAPNPAAGSTGGYTVDGSGRTNYMEWAVASHTDFTNNTLYTITVNLHDKAGNDISHTRQFRKDENAPVINTVTTPSGSIYNGGYDGGGTYVMMNGANVPLNPNPFTVTITDNPNDFTFGSTRYSLNADGLTPNGNSSHKSHIRLYSLEGAGLLSNDNDDNYTAIDANDYQGTLTINSFPNTDGLYAVSVTARDWAYYPTNPTHNYDNNLSIFLVDDTPPTESQVFPPQDTTSYYVTGGRTYLKTKNTTVYPQMISVTASDTPNDRLTAYFGRRLNYSTSTVTLLNPDNNTRTLSGSSWTQPGPTTDLNNNYVASINQTDPAPVYPVPEYVGNVIEGRYTVRVHLEDRITGSFGSPNETDVDYYFFNDITPPRFVSWNPFSTIPLADSYTSNFSDVQADIYDPDLRDGFPGSGLDLNNCMVDIFVGLSDSAHPTGFWNNPAGGVITSSGPFIGPLGQSLNNQPIEVFEVREIDGTLGRKKFWKVADSTISAGGAINITGLNATKSYVIGWEIPSTFAHDSVSVIGSIPDQAIITNGFYFANNFVADMVGNTSQVESINFNYLSPGGALTLTSNKTIIAADGSSTATVRTSPIYLSGSTVTVVPDGTLVTVSASIGQIITTDENTIIPGVQVLTSGGVAEFVVRSIASQAGVVTLRAQSVSGFADSGDVSNILEIQLSLLSNLTLEVKPAMEKLTAAYTITANSNQITPLIMNVDEVTITFAAGTFLPSTIASGAILINGTGVVTTTVNNQDLKLLLPITIPISSLITITIPESIGIVNPGSGVYTLSVLTTQDQVPATISYDIVIKITDDEVIPAPNPSKDGRVRFFFNLQGPGQAELMILNLKGDRVSRVRRNYGAAKKGEVIDWDTNQIAPGIYWTILTINYADGQKKVYDKKKVVIIP